MATSFKERNQVVLGIVGLAVSALLVSVSLNIDGIRSLLGETTYSAQLTDAGGARAGDDVRVDGVTVGSVKSVKLEGKVVEITFRAGDVRLGNKTKVLVRSENALGSKFLAIEPAGVGSENNVPLERTSPGYAVSEVLGRLTSNNTKIDVDQVAQSFESLTTVLEATPDEFSSALEGVSELARTVSKRDAELEQLFQRASTISSVLADRNEQIISLITQGSKVFDEIYDQRGRLQVLFQEVGRAADEINGLVEDNKATIGPKLDEITHLAKVLNEYRDELGYVLQTLPKYARSLGEAVGSGPFFQAYIPNLIAPESLANVDSILQSLFDSDTTGYIQDGSAK